MSRRLGPLAPDHPSVGQSCPACNEPLRATDFVMLVPLGPGKDQEERKARDQGRPYNAVGIVIHWDCGDARPVLVSPASDAEGEGNSGLSGSADTPPPASGTEDKQPGTTGG